MRADADRAHGDGVDDDLAYGQWSIGAHVGATLVRHGLVGPALIELVSRVAICRVLRCGASKRKLACAPPP